MNVKHRGMAQTVPLFNNKTMAKDSKNPEQLPNQINIELTDEIAEGIYSNLAMISHSPTEFVVDFVRVMPNTPKAKVKSRIVLTPQHAKRFCAALVENIKRYEQTFGTIEEPKQDHFPPYNFGGTPKAMA